MTDIWQLIISFLTGGGLLGLLTWVISNRKDKRVGLTTIIENYDLDNKRLRAEIEALREDFNKSQAERYAEEGKLKQEVTNLRNKLMLMESAHLDLPIPQWLKDRDGVMIAVNEAFERIFLDPMDLTAQDYLGKRDEDIWPEGNAERFERSDKLVVRTRKPHQFIETINYGDHTEQWDVLKYPRFEGRTYIGTAGIAFKKLEENTTSART